ncbi:MAG: beta-glucoside-specific PTS transporter subunit IIABC [Solibacillus sp.]
MDYQKLAIEILKNIGGQENIVQLAHCATRLRFTLADNEKADIAKLKKIDGVIEVVNKGQFQVIVGSHVNEVYEHMKKMMEGKEDNSLSSENKRRKVGPIILDFIVGVFQPLVPAMAGAGVLKAMLILLSLVNLIDKDGQTFLILTSISTSVFYFLPILVAITAATKLNVNPLVAAAAMSILLLPEMTTLITKGATLFSLPITNVNYANQVFPSILGVLFYALMEKMFTKIAPKPIRVFFVPMMALLFTVPVTLLLLGPLGFNIGTVFTSSILFIFEKSGWIAVGILAAGLPFIVATGMHKAAMPYIVSSFTGLGREMLFVPALLIHNLSESGAAFAVAVRTKDTDLKSISVSSGISALFGITEPALYGITLQRKRVLGSVIAACFLGGVSVGLFSLTSYAMVNPSVASIAQFVDPTNSKNFIVAIGGVISSFAVAFLFTFLSWKDDTQVDKSLKHQKKMTVKNDQSNECLDESVSVKQVVHFKESLNGNIIPLSEVKDEVFSSGVMGEGYAVTPMKGALYAPIDGKVVMVFNTNHALGVQTENGAELLFHIGIDTVQLGGKYFKARVKPGDEVKIGDLLVEFDLEEIVKAGYDPTTIIVITNKDKYTAKIESIDSVEYSKVAHNI